MTDPNQPGDPYQQQPGQPPAGGPPQPPSYPGGTGGGGADSYPSSGPHINTKKGFFGSLFDFKFENFVTPTIVKVVYVLSFILVILYWLGGIIYGFNYSTALGLIALIFGALGAIVVLCVYRMILEFVLAIVRMSEDVHARLPRY